MTRQWRGVKNQHSQIFFWFRKRTKTHEEEEKEYYHTHFISFFQLSKFPHFVFVQSGWDLFDLLRLQFDYFGQESEHGFWNNLR